jgi:D-xylulose reductase
MEEGALVEPSAVAVHVCKQAAVKPGDSVLVFGAGPVGLLCCAVSKAFGATKVISVDINEERLAFAKEYAATHVFRSRKESPEDSAKRLIEECELGAGADVVIDASGAEICIQTGIHAIRTGGTYCQAGMVGALHIFFSQTSLLTRI